MVVSCQCEHSRSAPKVNDPEWSGVIVIGDKVVENPDELLNLPEFVSSVRSYRAVVG